MGNGGEGGGAPGIFLSLPAPTRGGGRVLADGGVSFLRREGDVE